MMQNWEALVPGPLLAMFKAPAWLWLSLAWISLGNA